MLTMPLTGSERRMRRFDRGKNWLAALCVADLPEWEYVFKYSRDQV